MKKRVLKAKLAVQKRLVGSLRDSLLVERDRAEQLHKMLVKGEEFRHHLAPVLAKVVEVAGPPYEESGSVLVKICNESRAAGNYSIIEHVKDLRRLADEAIAARNRKRKPKLHIA